MENIPTWVEVTFLIAAVYTIIMFYLSNGRPKLLTGIIIIWCIAQSALAYSGFYPESDPETMPPRFTLVLLPATLLIIYGCFGKGRKWMLENRNTKISTFLHMVRIPVEIVLHQLFIYHMIPELMTYEGRNFDILAGITALIVGVLYWNGKISDKILLAWNFIGLFLIFFILFNGILSAELPFQMFAFDQPNRALNYFPFILLPAMIVPMVVYTHISDIINLMQKRNLN